jgi:periplasmic protein TonB
MTAENVGQTAGLSISGFTRWGAGPSKRERNFYIALACAAIIHASFFIHAAQNGDAKRLGSETGADDAISVALVTEQDLQSRSTIDQPVSPPPGPPPVTPQQAQPKPQPPQPQQPPQPEEAKQEPQPPAPPTPPEPQAEEKPQPDTPQPDTPQDADPAKPEEVAKQEDTSPDSNPADLFSLDDQDPSKMQSESKPKPKPEPKPETKPETKKSNPSKSAAKPPAKAQKKKVADLDLSTQAIAPSFGGGGAAAFQRPPGITRSGLNDAFARAVIRALQQTMPQLTNTLGRVTVRILLSESGNVVEVRLLNGAKDSSLNQDVVFAAKQTSYPIPPAGSNLADRTFMVTYIYD